jgi:predicted ferric reductase
VLCLQSLPIVRRKAYELFVTLHVPIAIVYLAMLFWHCHNFLTSWSYLWATAAIWFTSYLGRLFFLNWTRPWRLSWLIGDEAAITILPENAVKITIPTQMKWRPGQYVYLRMPGISWFENHPFTIASLCSDDFPSDYGEDYRDMVLVFRPFGGFTKKAMEMGIAKGPWHTYRAFIDGPYGGMKRKMESFDDIVLIAGGSGITAIVSQILDLIKRMRDGKAITKTVHVIWALKRPENMEWFREELRICREFAPPDSVKCQFFITAAKRREPKVHRMTAQTTQKHISAYFHDRVNNTFQGIADKRASWQSKRNSALIREEAEGNLDVEKHLRNENEDTISPLPEAHLVPQSFGQSQNRNFSYPAPPTQHHTDRGRNLSEDIATAVHAGNTGALNQEIADEITEKGEPEHFNFGFPSTPTEFQKNLMRFAFLPAAARGSDGWSTEYGRPDLPYTLRQMSRTWGRRTCVFVCGPPSMRIAVAKSVAELQMEVLRPGNGKEEIFLHTENYAI